MSDNEKKTETIPWEHFLAMVKECPAIVSDVKSVSPITRLGSRSVISYPGISPQPVTLNGDGSLSAIDFSGKQITFKLLKPFNVKKDLDTISVTWSIEDVHGATDNELTDEQARGVLLFAKENHDADRGIDWDTLRVTAQHLYGYEG